MTDNSIQNKASDLDFVNKAFNKSNILTDYLLKMKSIEINPNESNLMLKNTERVITSPEVRRNTEKIRSPKIIFNKQKFSSTSFMSFLDEEDDLNNKSSKLLNKTKKYSKKTHENSFFKRRVKSKSPDSNPSISLADPKSLCSSGSNIQRSCNIKNRIQDVKNPIELL